MSERFYINGYTLETVTDARMEGVVVRLLERRQQLRVPLATAVSDANGFFRLVTEESVEDAGGLLLEFYYNEQRLTVVEGTSSWSTKLPPKDFVYRLRPYVEPERIDDVTFTNPGPQGMVRGVVKHDDGSPVSGVKVRVFSQALGGATQLGGDVTSGIDGKYELLYTYPQTAPHLYVQVRSPNGSILLKASTLQLSVPPIHRVDFTLKTPDEKEADEYARMHLAIDPLLVGPPPVDVNTMKTESVVLLVAQLRQPLELVRAYVVARRLATKLTPNTDVLYALVRQGLPTIPHQLTAVRPALITQALNRAASENQISAVVASTASTVIAQLRADSISMSADIAVPNSIGKLLEKGVPNYGAAEREKFAQLWHENNDSPSAFWTAVGADGDLNGQINKAKRTVQLGLLSLNHPPLVAAFEASAFGTGNINRIAELDTQQWRSMLDAIVDTQPVGAPDGVQGTGAVQLDNYASLLKAQAEAAFPSETIVADVKRADQSSSNDLTIFLNDNPSFVFGSTDVDDFYGGASLGNVNNTTALKKQLKRMQRLYRISPATGRYSTMKKLDDNGIRSSRDITRMGRKRFVQRFTSVLGDAVAAKAIYNRAQMASSMAQILYLQGSPLLQEPRLATIPTATNANSSGIDGYNDMFVVSANCACKHCTSALSPSAYFVDLMEWLKERDALGTLLDRRPDLEELKLSCENTHNALPYVDLAIEILEEAVATGDLSNLPTQTTRNTDELIAQPEYTTASAYTTLKTATGPLGLPFHYEHAQVDGYLEHLGVDFAALLSAFQSGSTPTDEAIEDARFDIFPDLRSLLTTTSHTDTEARDLWGYSSTTVAHPAPEVTASVNWKDALAYVPELVKRANIPSYEALLDLLHARYVNPGSPPQVVLHAADGKGCELSQLYLNDAHPNPSNVDRDFYARLVLFRRLQRILGWSALELDKAFHALNITSSSGNTGFTGSDLTELLRLKRLVDHTGADLARLLSWWKTLDTYPDHDAREEPIPSLFETLFLDPSVTEPATSDFKLDPTTLAELDTTGPDLLANHETELLAALNTDAEELSVAAGLVATEKSLSGPEALEWKMEHLWLLSRRVHLAQTAGLSVEEADFFSTAIGIDPFSSVSLALQWLPYVRLSRLMGTTLAAQG